MGTVFPSYTMYMASYLLVDIELALYFPLVFAVVVPSTNKYIPLEVIGAVPWSRSGCSPLLSSDSGQKRICKDRNQRRWEAATSKDHLEKNLGAKSFSREVRKKQGAVSLHAEWGLHYPEPGFCFLFSWISLEAPINFCLLVQSLQFFW